MGLDGHPTDLQRCAGASSQGGASERLQARPETQQARPAMFTVYWLRAYRQAAHRPAQAMEVIEARDLVLALKLG